MPNLLLHQDEQFHLLLRPYLIQSSNTDPLPPTQGYRKENPKPSQTWTATQTDSMGKVHVSASHHPDSTRQRLSLVSLHRDPLLVQARSSRRLQRYPTLLTGCQILRFLLQTPCYSTLSGETISPNLKPPTKKPNLAAHTYMSPAVRWVLIIWRRQVEPQEKKKTSVSPFHLFRSSRF